jgi:hypothetical protein
VAIGPSSDLGFQPILAIYTIYFIGSAAALSDISLLHSGQVIKAINSSFSTNPQTSTVAFAFQEKFTWTP